MTTPTNRLHRSNGSPVLKWFRANVKTPATTLLLAAFALWTAEVKGATIFNWNGGAGTWDTSTSNWSGGGSVWVNSNDSLAVFGGTSGLVTLGAPITAGGLTFSSNGYTLTSGTITLAAPNGQISPIILVSNNGSGTNSATISSVVAGTSGFTKTGNGNLRLTNSGNTFSGDISIKGGTLFIDNVGQLGAGTTAIQVLGLAQTGNPGYSGGSLALQGNATSASSTGLTLTREVSISGRGPNAVNNTGGVVSIGYNTIAGGLTLGNAVSEARAWATHGTTTISGAVDLGTGGAQLLQGNGNWNISGQVTGVDAAADRFIKTGQLVTTTLWLQNASNNFAQTLRIDSGTARVATNSALGLNISSQAVDLNNGTLEVRTDAPTGFNTRNVFVRDNTTGAVFVDHGIAGSLSLGTLGYSSLLNQTVTFGNLRATGLNSTLNFNGRNGWGATFLGSGGTIAGGGNNNAAINNNSSGTLTLDASLWNQTDGTARTLTISGGGDTVVTGRIIASGATHAFAKGGSGTLTLTQGTAGTSSTLTGDTTISDGTLAIRTLEVLNEASTRRILLGGGALSFLGDTGTGAGETWTSKNLNIAAANSYLLANQSGTAPTALIIPTNWGADNTGTTKTLNLGGSSNQINEIQGLITNGVGATNVFKYGTGTWQISAPTSYGTANGSFAITAIGTTASNTVTTTSTAGLVVGQPISGTGFAFGTVITGIISSTQFTISKTAVSTGTTVVLGAADGVTSNVTSTAASTGTTNPVITMASTANLVPGQRVTSTNLPATGNWYIRDITSATTVTLASATGASVTAGAVLNGEVITPVASPNFGGTLSVSNGVLRLNAATASSNIVNNTSNLIFANDSVTNLGNAGGTLEYVGFSGGSSTEALGRLNPAAGHGIVKITSGAGADTLTFIDLSRAAGATLDLQPGIGTVSFSTAPTLTNGVLPGYITYNGVDFVTLSGSDAVAFTGYTTGLPASGASATANYLSDASVTTTAAQVVNSLKISGTQTITLGGNLTFTTNPGGILFDNSSGPASITGAFQVGTTAQELVITTNGTTSSNALTIDSPLSSAAGSLTKAGTGTLILTGASAYTGNTIINQGTVQMSGATAALGAITTAGNITSVRQGATLDVNGAGATAALYTGGPSYPTITIGTLSGAGAVTNSGGGVSAQSTLNIGLLGTTTSNATFSGALQDGAGVLNVTKNGTGTQAIVGAKSYTGVTTINAGTLAVTSLGNGGTASGVGASSSAPANLVFGGGTLLYTGANTSGAGIYQTTQTPSTTTDRLFTLAGNATIQSSGTYGNESGAAGTGQNNASLIFSNTGDIDFGTTGAKTLTLGGTSIGDNVFRPHIIDNTLGGATALTKADAGLWILDPGSANNYTGATTVSGGALRAVDGVGISASSVLTLNGGVYEVAGSTSFTRSLGTGAGNVQLTGGTSGFANPGTSRLVVNLGGTGGTVTWGSGTFNPTALVLGSSTSMGETEFANGIDLGAAARTVTVNNNGNTGTMVTAGILSGVITGSAGGTLTKNGGGTLILGNANTYVGNTIYNAGSLVVTSIGNATGTASSSLGASGGALQFNVDTDLNGLIYVGPGETASRPLQFVSANLTANRNYRIDSSGSGALVLSGTFTNSQAGSAAGRILTLDLRGSNTDNNMVTSVLSNATGTNTPALAVAKSDGGVWILNPATPNTFTGGLSSTGGSLGLTANGIGAMTAITLNNGGMFAYGGPLATTAIVQGNNSTAVFTGQNAITIGGMTKTAGNNAWNISNNLENGALLTVNGNFVNNENGTAAATQTISIRGYGSTLWNGAITENAAAGGKIAWNIALAPTATFTTTGAANTYSGGTTLSDGILIIDKTSGPLGATSGTFNFNGGTLRVGTIPASLTIANPIVIGGSPPKVDGTKSIDFSGVVALGASRTLQNELSGGAQLTISTGITNTAASTLTLFGSGNTLISGTYNAGTGANGLAMSGTGTLTLTGANAATGALTTNKGTTVMSGANGAWTAGTFTLNANGILRLDNSLTNNNNRLFDTGAVTMNGGILDFISNSSNTAEVAGALTVNNLMGSINMSGAGSSTLTFASVNFANTGSSLDLTGILFLGTTNKLLFTTAPTLTPATTGIHTRFMIPNEFATYGANGVVAFTGYNNTNNLDTAAATDTMNITANASMTNPRTLNAIKINGSGLTVSSTGANRSLLLTAGGILNTGGNNTLSIQQVNFNGGTGYIQVESGTTLNVTSALSNGAINKTGPGTLTLSAPNYYGSSTNVSGGTLELNGGTNTIFPAVQVLNIDVGATVDLKGNTQYIGALQASGSLPGTAGTLTSSTGTGTIVTNGGGTFAGQITNGVNLGRIGGGTLTLEMAQTYTGGTMLIGGTTTLENDASLLTTPSIDINFANLTINNNSSLQTQNNNRIGDTIPITLRGGTLSYTGRLSSAATETFGALTFAQGANTLTANTGGGTFTSTDLTFASFTRNNGATVNFTGTTLGQLGNSSHVVFQSPLNTVLGGALGAWAIANQTDFAAYNTGSGIGIVGQGGYVGYDAAFGTGLITQIPATVTTTTTLPAGNTTTGMLRIAGAVTNNVAFTNATDILNLEQGGLLRSDNANFTAIGNSTLRGILTAGGNEVSGTRELVVYSNQAGTTNFTGGATNAGSNVITMTATAGLEKGMIITNASLPAGTYVVSVDSATQVTVSQNATAASTAQTFVGGTSNFVINSVVADNGFGNNVQLIKSGAGVMNLSAPNTYTGGTIFHQGTVNLIGSGTVIPAGPVTLNGATLVVNTNTNQIATTNSITLNDSSSVTFNTGTGTNTLSSLTFNNQGGTGTPTVTIQPLGTLSLTSANPISVTTANASTVPTITGGFLALTNGANTINVGAPTLFGNVYTTVGSSLNIASAITGSGSIVKTGNGLVNFSGQSVFTGGLNVTTGGIIVGASSTPAQGGSNLTSGPLGVGAVTMAAGTTMLVDNTRSIGNAISFAGTPTFDSTANTVWTLNLNGTLTGAGLASPTPTIQITNPFLTVALLGQIPNIGTITSFNKTGLGTLIFNSTGYTGDFNASALGNPSLVQLLNDGDGTGSVQNISLGNVIFDAGIVPNITVGRAGGSILFPTPVNKILQPASISNLSSGLTVTNNNGYGLRVASGVTFAGTPTINVVNATASNVTQGLYYNGVLDGTGFIKTGAGTVVLGNFGNTFTGNINIQTGVVSIADQNALGNAANLIQLNPSTGTSTFRATNDITTSRVVQLSNTANTRNIEVVGGRTLQLDSAFDLNAGAGATASLAKGDQGTLLINASNTGWSGALNINQGAVLVNNSSLTNPLGTGTINVSPGAAVVGAALQLAGGVTISNPLNLQGTNNLLNGGINFQGQLDNVSGTNTYSGGIAMPFDSTIGARAGSTLNITGLITATGTHRLQFNAEGDINVTGGETGALFGFDKYGAGTLTITSALFGGTITTGGVKVEKGTLVLSGAGTTNSNGAVNIVYQGATMRLDNSGTNTNNRLTGRALTLQGGTFDFIANNSTETAGAFVADQGANTINMTGTGTSALTFSTFTGNAGGTLNVTGTFGTATNFLKFTTAPALTPASTGILARVTTDGNEFATYNATNGIVPFTGYSPASNILSAGTTQTFKATASTANSLTGNQTLNALTLTSSGTSPNVGGLSGLNPTTLTLTSGGILANGTGTGSTLSVPVVAFGSEAIVHVAAGQTLNVTSGFSGASGLSKDLPGTLSFDAPQFVSGATFVNGGTLKLNGGNNTLLFNNAVAVNFGGTLDLNGNNQFMAGLSSASAGGSTGVAGGTVTNSAGGQSTLTINGNTNFGGVISGNIYLNKTGTGALNLQQPQTYTGPTLITGGTMTLNDNGALPNTSQPIDIRFGGLSLANGNFYDVSNRVNDTAPINLTGGVVTVAGRQQASSSETLGAVTLNGGHNQINTNTGGTNVNSLDVTIASLTRTDTSATLRMNATGQLGSSARLYITANPLLTNNIIGPWAIVDREFASYDATYGVGALNGNGFPGYSGAGLNSGSTGTDNVRFTTAGTTPLLGNTTVGTLTFASQTTATVLNLNGFNLTIQNGGLLMSQATDNVDFSFANGNITSGTLNNPSDLFIHHTNYAGTGRTVTFNAPIVNNGTGAVRVIYNSGQIEGAGVGNTNLNAINTNTGGTIINAGNYVLGATGGLGTGGLTINQGVLTQTAGGVIPAQAWTMNGASAATLAGNNSLTTLTINNNGGTAPTLTPTGVLTITGGITAITSSPGTISTIGTGTIDLSGNASFPISVGAAIVNGVDTAPWQAGLNITSAVQNGGIVKTGAGLLGMAGQGTYSGGTTVSAGGLVLGASSTPSGIGDTVISGPLGTGAVTMAANTTMVATAAVALSNNFTFLGNTVFNGTNNINLNGITTLPSTWNATVTAPQTTVTIADATPSLATDVINKSGLGILTVGNYAGTIQATGGLVFTGDGNLLGTPENISLGGGLAPTGDVAITVNRSGSAPNSRNKTLQKTTLTIGGNILSVSNQNGYGLEFTGTTAMSGPAHFAVGIATASNAVPGLKLSGQVTGAGVDMIKSGPGTLLLTNATNSFGGPGNTISVLNGILAASSDGALGDPSNTITLDVDGSTNVGFRATGTFSTARTFILNQANNAFEVTAGNVLTLNSAFTVGASNTLTKNDNGVLELLAGNVGWSGAVTINGGAIRVGDNNALGSGTITLLGSQQAALQLTNNVTVANPFTVNVNASTGINSGGDIESFSGSNTYSGLITYTSGNALTLGARSGATLTVSGGTAPLGNNSVIFSGAGTINVTTTPIGNGATGGNSISKIGSGTLNIQVGSPAYNGAALSLQAGSTVFSGTGLVGTGSTQAVTVDAGASLTLDNSLVFGGNVNNRLGGSTRPITLRGGSLSIIGTDDAGINTSEALAAPTFARGYSVVTVTAQGGNQANLTFGAAANNVAPAQTTASSAASVLFRGTSLGTAAGPNIATIANSTGGFTFNGQTGATNTKNKGILPWALVDTTTTGNGVSFATTDAAAGAVGTAILRPLNAGEYETANTFVANNNINLTSGTTSVTATINVNSLTIAGNAGIAVDPFRSITGSSGGILVKTGSTSSISGGILTQAAAASPFNVWTLGDLTVTSLLNGGNGTANGSPSFMKAGAGTLTLSTPLSQLPGLTTMGANSLSGQTVINQGTLKLNGGTNTIQANNFIEISVGGTLDLNGNSQQVLGLFTDGVVDGAGGVITSSTGTGNLVVNQDNAARNWAGSIQGAVNFTRSGQNTMTVYSAQTYSGSTLINGGTTVLRDAATILNTSSIDINYATLTIDNNAGTMDLDNRVGNSIPITLRGGTLAFNGRNSTASTETVGAVTLAQGNSFINSVVGGGVSLNSTDLTLTSLNRAVGGATVNFTAATGGLIGSSSRILVPTINGVSTATAYSAMNDGIIGGWAVIGTSDWATYVPDLGIAAMGQAGAPQYSNSATTAATLNGAAADDNINLNTVVGTIPVTNDTTINSLRFGNVATNTVAIAAGKTLTLDSGGLLFFSTAVQNVGATVGQGNLTSAGPELFIYTQGTGPHVINSVVTGANNLVKSGGNTLNLAATNTYTGGTTVNQGTLNVLSTSVIPLATDVTKGLVINGGTVTTAAVNGIASGNLVTLNGGGSVLTLFGNNTIEGMTFNSNGGGASNVQVNTFSTASATGAGSTGVLTIGNAGITATSSNVTNTGIIIGRVDFGSTNKTINVAPINVNGVDVAPLQAAFALQSIVGTTGGITKTGNGVLQFNAQSHYTGPTVVSVGGIRNGVTNAGSRFSALTLNSGTRYDLNNISTTWGSLSGAGTIFSTAGGPTLSVGFANTSTTFSGQFARYNDATMGGVVLQKIGTGTMTLDSAQSFATGTTGAITVNGGGITYSGAGAAFPATAATGGGTFNVNTSGTLALDNTGTNVNNRLGANVAGTVNLQGGLLSVSGNSGGNTSEAITTFNILNGGGKMNLTADPAAALGFTITTLSNPNGSGAAVFTGIDGSVVGTVGKATLSITTPALIGGQGTGANGTVTMGVRHDILADATVGGIGTGFLVKDSVSNTYRALGSSELASAIALPLTTDVDPITAGNQAAGTLNVGLTGGTQSLTVNSVANTLTASGTNTVNSGLGTAFGGYGPGGNLLGFTLSGAAASLTLAGATTNINVGNFGSTTAGTTIYAHVQTGGTLNVNGAFGVGNTSGMNKSDGGVMNLNLPAFYTGTTVINGGALNLNSGFTNTIPVVPTAGGAVVSRLDLNGTNTMIDLKGQSQTVGQLVSVNPLPGQGGVVTNTGALATFTSNTQAGSSNFGGSITGALAFTKTGTNTLTLTSANSYTGATAVRGGTLQLRDSGTISSTAGLTLNYGTLLWDNFGLNPSSNPTPTRIAAANPVTLQGGTFMVNGAGSTDTILALNTVTVTGGQNTINTLPFINEGSTVKLTIGNLVRNATNHSGVNFNGFTTNNSGGSNTLGGQGLTTNSNIMITQLNGAAFSASSLTNGLIGGWAVADGSTFATYDNTFGVVAMGNAYGGFSAPAFTGTDISAATVATGNYNDGSNRTLTTGVKAMNSLRMAPGAAQTITPVSGTSWTFGTGIITNANFAITVGAVDATNTISGTGTDLYFYVNQNTTVVNPAITGTAALVSNGPATLRIAPTFASNTYTGGTFINGGTTNLQAATGFVAIPGDVTITNATLTYGNTVAGQIAATSNITMNGAAVFNLPAYTASATNTYASLTFNNEGGNGNPTFAMGTPTGTGTLSTVIFTAANAITATNNTTATTPTISTGDATRTALQFSAASPVITVNAGLAATGLTISAPITQNAGMTSPLAKSGVGALALAGASTFTTGVNLDQGSLILGANSTPTTVGAAVTSGPLGTGALNIAAGTTLLSDNTARTVANVVNVNGDFTVGGVVAGNSVTLNGAVNLGATGRTITVTSPAVTATIGGAVTSTATGTALTKAGAGTLTLSSATNNFGGASVAVTGGILKNGVNNAIPATSGVNISAGAGYDLNNFDQTVDTVAGTGFITNSANASKTLTVSSTVNNTTFNGVLTDNALAQANSRLVVTKAGAGTTLTLGGANSYSGATNVNAGMVTITNGSALGTTTAGTTVASGASLELQGGITVGNENLAITGTGTTTNGALRNLSGSNTYGGTVTIGTGGAMIQSDAGTLTLNNATAAVSLGAEAATFTGAGNTTVTTPITGTTGTLTKSGAGILTLTGANTYQGATTVSGGTLVANNATGSATGTGAVTVDATATLAGNGFVVPASGTGITVNGTVAVGTPGAIAGEDLALTVQGAANLTLNGTIRFDLFANAQTGSLNALTANDLLAVSAADWANVVFGGTSILKVDNTLPTTGWVQGDAWKIFDWSGITAGTAPSVGSGGFATVDLPVLDTGKYWDTSQLYSTGVISITLIPEPSRMMLLFLGLFGLCLRRRRK